MITIYVLVVLRILWVGLVSAYLSFKSAYLSPLIIGTEKLAQEVLSIKEFQQMAEHLGQSVQTYTKQTELS
ncbi:hypothetical protein [Oceanobacillus timonensis]|uniref:hypothetical protein n=1 Tax=Oceanobacillus timonensis TaxID=1926285 RepID=UPI0009BB9157|nr:hypothetical protein [Oceanobacillus timonensis]